MAAKAPIPKEGIELFKKALAVFYAWIVDELNEECIEPSIVQRCSIGAACDLIQPFDDPMPENVHELLIRLAAERAVPAPADRSYASGATCLRAMRNKHLASIE